MSKVLSFFKRIFGLTKEVLSDSTGSSLCGAFISGYYAYLGIVVTVMTGNPGVFVVWAMPAILSLLIIITEAWICSRA